MADVQQAIKVDQVDSMPIRLSRFANFTNLVPVPMK